MPGVKRESTKRAIELVLSGKMSVAQASRETGVAYHNLWDHVRSLGFKKWKDKLELDRRPISERIWDVVEKRENGCWLWTGRRIGSMTHGLKSYNPRNAIREVLGLPLHPKAKIVFSSCGTPNCINPEHEAVEKFEARNNEIRARWAKSEEAKTLILTMEDLGKEYGLTRQRIEQIVNGGAK